MPIVQIYAFDRSIETKREAVRQITDVMCRTYGVQPHNVSVQILTLTPENVAHGGMLVSDRRLAEVANAEEQE